MDWISNIKSFIDVVDTHSFTKAAEKRFTSPAGISRRIAWLEDRLGVSLLARTTRTLRLTTEGSFFYERSKQLLANLEEITQEVHNRGNVLKGPLKITLPVSFGEFTELMQLFKSFIDEHPAIELNLDFSNSPRDLLAEEIDIAFRSAPSGEPQYQSQKILALQMGIFAAPAYLAQKGEPQSILDIPLHNCLLHKHMGYFEWEFSEGRKIAVSGNIQANASQPLIELAKAGSGIVRTLMIYVLDAIRNNTLQAILENDWPKPVDIYLVYRSGAATAARIHAFAEFASAWFDKKILS